MTVIDRMRTNRATLAQDLARGRFRRFSAASVLRFRLTNELVATYVAGRVLDVGCGHMPFRELVIACGGAYESLDIEPRTPGVDYITSATEMRNVPEAAFDTALCFEVLEHVEDPLRTLEAIASRLRPDGVLLLTVPHLSRLHEEPNDYFRYTVHGLRVLLKKAGFEIVRITPYGGPASFLSHQISTGIVCLFFHIHGLRHIAYFVNQMLFVYPALWVDRLIDRRNLIPLGYGVVATRRRTETVDRAS